MTRRDTILIAVLVNAGLLVVLFATALPSKNAGKISSEPLAQITPVEIVPAPVPVHAALPTDEVDQVLKQYNPQITQEAPLAANTVGDFQTQGTEIDHSSTFTTPTRVETIANPNFIEVKVKKGDVLDKIARNHHCQVDEIMRLNSLSSTRLHIGQVLKVPSKSEKKETVAVKKVENPQPVQEAPPSTGVKYYTVKVGDNPWTIAVKNHMKVEELLKLNNLNEDKARRLKPGDQIRIK